MTENEKIAIRTFRSGYNCAQAVLKAYADELNFDSGKALSIATGFGGGMGRLQETCGAVTGAFMVISLYCCKNYKEITERKDNSYAMIREFDRKFREIHGTSNCRELLNCDLLTEEGRQKMITYKLNESVCEKCVVDAVRILEEMLGVRSKEVS